LLSQFKGAVHHRTNALVAHYDYGADRLRMDRGGAYYYVYDGLGSVRVLTNAGDTVTDTYAYDAFGNTTHGLGSSPNPYQFNGQSNDATGLYFLRARYYNPGDGRFLSSTIKDDSFENWMPNTGFAQH